MLKYSWNYVRLVLMFSIMKKTSLSSKLKIHCSTLFKMREHQLRHFSGFWQLSVTRSNAHSRGVNSCWKYWLRSIFQCYKILCLLCAWLLSCSAVQYGAYIVILIAHSFNCNLTLLYGINKVCIKYNLDKIKRS